ncbi:hypothetical protein B1P92_06120 [Enterococcus faecium]|nr:hypothetical protein B1P92_06120 [Enterococcus faecium]
MFSNDFKSVGYSFHCLYVGILSLSNFFPLGPINYRALFCYTRLQWTKERMIASTSTNIKMEELVPVFRLL